MSDISLVLRLSNGAQRQVDLSQNNLVVGLLKVGFSSPTSLSQAILNNLIALQNGTDFSTGTNSHTHDGRYYTQTQVAATGSGTAGSTLVGDDNSYSNFTPSAATVKGALAGIDTKLGTLGASNSFTDSLFNIYNNSDNSKKIAFTAAGISTATTRTITMPDSNVDLGKVATAIQKDGSVTFTADQPMGTHKLTGLSAGSAAGHSVRYEQAILVSGANAFAANQSMGGNKLTSLAAASANGDAVRFEQAVLTDGSHAITGDQSFSGTAKITNLVDPVSAQDGATKAYVDSAIAGLSWKEAARVASTADLNLASMPATVDGVTLSNGDRFLAKDQSTAADNGVYVFNGSSSAATRSTDADSWIELVGAVIYIEEGTANAGSKWVDTNVSGGTLGTTAVTFTVFAAASALDGIGTTGYNAYWTAAHTLAAEQYVATVRGGLATDASAFTGLLKFSAGVASASALVNADVAAGAAIAYSKLNLSGSIVNADVATGAAIVYSKLSLTGSIVDADIASGAAIAYSKLNLSNSIVAGDITSNAVTTAKIQNNAVDQNKIATSAYDQVTITGGGGSAAAVQSSPTIARSAIAGQSFSANTTYAVRWGQPLNSETAGRLYACDKDASSQNNYNCVGVIQPTGAISAGGTVTLIRAGSITLLSNDTNFASNDVGTEAMVGSSGVIIKIGSLAGTANEAASVVGMIQAVNKIDVGGQHLRGIA